MKESYRKGVATILTPNHARAARKDALEALARGICRLGIPKLRTPKSSNPGADGVMTTGRQQDGARYCERAVARRSQRPQACIETGRPAGVAGPKGTPAGRPWAKSRGPVGEGDEL